MNKGINLLVLAGLIIAMGLNSLFVIDEKEDGIVFQFGEAIKSDLPTIKSMFYLACYFNSIYVPFWSRRGVLNTPFSSMLAEQCCGSQGLFCHPDPDPEKNPESDP